MIEGQSGKSFVRKPLREHLERCLGKTLGELDVANVFGSVAGIKKRTGVIGDVVEYSVLSLTKDGHSQQAPDIAVDGVRYEVKWSPQKAAKPLSRTFRANYPEAICAGVSTGGYVEYLTGDGGFGGLAA